MVKMEARNLTTAAALVLMACGICLLHTCTGSRLSSRPTSSLQDDNPYLEDVSLLEDEIQLRRRNPSSTSNLWLGPRLGRRQRRSPASDEDAAEDGVALVELLKDAPWALIALKDYPAGRRHSLTFTPRLGRESEPAVEISSSSTELRSPPFSPRLGRSGGLPFSPRLGRQQEPLRFTRAVPAPPSAPSN